MTGHSSTGHKSADSEALILDAEQLMQMPLAGMKLIEASAGTGKTYAIANFYLRYILAGYVTAEILVVTFTNAATEELRGRIRQRLHEALRVLTTNTQSEAIEDEYLRLLLWQDSNGSDKAERVARLKLATRTMDEAAIHTIHGFCQRTLIDHAFYSGQGFDTSLSAEDDLLWQQSLQDWWRKSCYELDADKGVLFATALGSFSAFMKRQRPLRRIGSPKILPTIAESPDKLYELWLACRKPASQLARQWQQRGEEIKAILLNSNALSRRKEKYGADNLQALFLQWDDFFGKDDLLQFPAQFDLLSADTLQKNTKPTAKEDPALQDPFFLTCAKLINSTESIRSRFLFRALQEATAYAREKIEAIKLSSGSMTFNDQLTRLHAALHGPQGSILAQRIRQSFPVAMIDEFQDTDAIQYAIFRQIYQFPVTTVAQEKSEGKAISLLMIGDPKQAIYSFRGGDIFTYMQARKDVAAHRYTLDTNWRSTPGLVDAVNAIFGYRQDPFLFSDAIEFKPVKPNPVKNKPELLDEGKPKTPLVLWRLPVDEKSSPFTSSSAAEQVQEAVADEIASLIKAGSTGRASLGDKSLTPGDVAVLVRTLRQGNAVREALSRRGINAVTVGWENVFNTDEAQGLLLILQALVYPEDKRALRRALSSSLLAYTYLEIAEHLQEENRAQWKLNFYKLSILWQQKGFMVMFQTLLQSVGIGSGLAQGDMPERRLTNLLHLAELLQQKAKQLPGHIALLNWYQQQLGGEDKETELRLESDEALVKIVTIHASKGLEYPLVFVPFLWSCRPASAPLCFHDEQGQLCIDLGSDTYDGHLPLAEKERLAEDVRLAYVALTRASARLYLVWGESMRSNAEKTALSYLFVPEQQAAMLDTQLPQAYQGRVDTGQVLSKLCKNAGGTITVSTLPQSTCNHSVADTENSVSFPDRTSSANELQAAVFSGRNVSDWRINSFSSLTRNIHQNALAGKKRSSSRDELRDEILNFPAGSHVGLFMHALLEEIDFQSAIGEQARVVFQRHAPRYGLDHRDNEAVVGRWLESIVHTVLDQTTGFSLACLASEQRLNELEFDFSVARFDPSALNALLARHSEQALMPLQLNAFQGVMTGVIDLVFCTGGRYYLADYKSNFLGATLSDYNRASMHKAIIDRRYDLQYLLYCVALHRYLQWRIPDYAYQTHFGGVYYLFLRGMRSERGPEYGVFYDRPAEALVLALDALFADSSSGRLIH
ncbi:MAG: exodeoxyribonuclease V subunit beta [Pseudomonadales bacterium]|nr:exodeoxyribonuclease V subunit beta [Pseudomonadales bacterium]